VEGKQRCGNSRRKNIRGLKRPSFEAPQNCRDGESRNNVDINGGKFEFGYLIFCRENKKAGQLFLPRFVAAINRPDFSIPYFGVGADAGESRYLLFHRVFPAPLFGALDDA
jgi:hypothetical protein